MSTQINAQWLRTMHAPYTAALWATSTAGWILLLLTDPASRARPVYYALGILAAMGACTRIAVTSMGRISAKLADVLERSNDVNAALVDVAAATALRVHADTNHPTGPPYPLTDLEDLRPEGWSRSFYYNHVRQRAEPLGEATNVVPMSRDRRNAS
jgi:hypothetical protein